jgi:Putative Actinobacterial Holin-X, holin superfamily III
MIETPVTETVRNSLAPIQAKSESTLAELVSGIADDAQRLIQQQYQMLRAELREDFRRTKAAAKYMGVGAVGMVVGSLFFVVSVPLFLNWLFALPPWAGWAIIGSVMLLGGGIALFVGKRKFDKFNPLPDKTLNALEENISWIANHRN